MRADQVIIEPVLSEKTNIAREGEIKKYTFKVRMDSNKFQIVLKNSGVQYSRVR